MSDDHRYYLAAGRSLELARAHIDAIQRHLDAWCSLSEEIGSAGVIRRSNEIVALAEPYETKPPRGWKSLKVAGLDQRGWFPNKRTAEGRAVLERMAATPYRPTSRLTNDLLGVPYLIALAARGRTMYGVGAEKFGDEIVLVVPSFCERHPPDAIPLKTSEYWLRREACEAAEQATLRSWGGAP